MKLTWTKLSGIRPKTDRRLLPDGAAQIAQNICTESGGIVPVEGQLDIMALAKQGTIKTIYRFGQALNSATQFWFHWTTEVDVVKGPIAEDTAERTYWTGPDGPRYTTAQAGLSGNNLPSTSFPIGVSAPASAPLLAVSGTGNAGAVQETRVYIYTYVTVNGEESAPSQPATITITVGQGVTLTNLEAVAENGAIVATKRIYRSQRGVYLYVGTVAAGTPGFNDTVESASLGESCPSIDWDLPSQTMFGLTAGPNGMMAALDGYTVRLCEPFRPHAWPQKYSQTVQYPTVGIGQFGQTFVILTTGLPAILTGTAPANMSVTDAKFYQPCLSRRSIVSAAGNVMWASPDGLVSIGANGEQNLTMDLFTPKQWRALAPETLIGAWHEDWYVGTFERDGARTGFMFRPSTQEWVDLPGLVATAMYRDTVGDALYLCEGGRIKKFRGGPRLIQRWKSPVTVTPMMDFAAARVTGDYPLTFRLYRDTRLIHTQQVLRDEPFKLPAGLGTGWEIEVTSAKILLGISLATTEGEL